MWLFLLKRLSCKILVSLNDETTRGLWVGSGSWSLNRNTNPFTWRTFSGATGMNILDTGFWSSISARRLMLKVTVQPKSECKNENDTACLINFAFWRANDETDTPIYETRNITFPRNTFLDTNVSTSNVFINGMGNKSGIFIRFQTNEFHGSLSSVDLEYYMCPSVSEKLVDFPAEAAPDENENERIVNGNCTTNAALEGAKPFMKCKYDGSYDVIGKCVCKAGYQPKDKKCEGEKEGL